MFIEQTRPYLEYFGLVFFNLFFLVGFFIMLAILLFVWQIKNKITQLMDTLNESTQNLSETAEDTLYSVQEAAVNFTGAGFNFMDIFGFVMGMAKNNRRKNSRRRTGESFWNRFRG